MKDKKQRKLNKTQTVLIIALIAFVVCILANQWQITITPAAGDQEHVELGGTYEDTGASAEATGSVFTFLHKTLEVTASGTVNPDKPGDYEITYTASYGKYTGSKTKTVTVSDTEGPVITLVSDPDGYTPYGHPYQEEDYSAVDVTDGDVTDKVVSEEKDGKVYYHVADSLGNTSEAVREIHYDDRLGPVINLNGDSEITWYTDQGGYSFKSINAGSYVAHHPVNN